MVDADADPAGVGGDVVDAVGDGFAELLVHTVVHVDLLGLTGWPPFAAAVGERPDQLLLLTIDAHDRIAGHDKPGRGVVQVAKLGGTISRSRIAQNGSSHLAQGKAAFLGDSSQPVDLVQSADYLYLLLRGTGAVASFKVGSNGDMTPLGIAKGGLPVADGASGLAVY